LRATALDLATFALSAIAAQPQPMSKTSGEMFGRLTSAVARLAQVGPTDVLLRDGFE
jgi:hypothetical protein